MPQTPGDKSVYAISTDDDAIFIAQILKTFGCALFVTLFFFLSFEWHIYIIIGLVPG